MPREVKFVAPEKLEILDYDLPELGEDQVRIGARFAAPKHGTELAFVKGYGARRGRYNRELGAYVRDDDSPKPFRPHGAGNMFVGEVTEVGAKVETVKVGDRVLSYGGFREVHTIAEGRCWKMPDDLSWKSAVCLDPADFPMAVRVAATEESLSRRHTHRGLNEAVEHLGRFGGEPVRLKDLWARAATQIFTQGISPAMHDEFAVQYELQSAALSASLDERVHVI